MTLGGRYAPTLLFIGDIAAFAASLWLTLLVRYREVPGQDLLSDHFIAFAPLFLAWLLVFYMAGLYGKRVVFFARAQFGTVLRTQLANVVIAALYFFFVPSVGLQPKTNLLLYLLISLALILFWRLGAFPRLTKPSSRERAALIGAGQEADELLAEVNGNPRYPLVFVMTATPRELSADFEGFRARLRAEAVATLVVDAEREDLRESLPRIYDLAFARPGYPVLDFYAVYEEVFDRVPLSLLEYDWFLKNLSGTAPGFYPAAKRAIDLLGGLLMGLVTVVATPFVALALRIEGPGPVFIRQDRIGRYGAPVRSLKFRSMRYSDEGAWKGERDGAGRENRVTRVGAFLRQTSLDEFPQFANVLAGELSLIGPRNDIRALGLRLGEAVPYYHLRYIVPPGITGWAQINQKYEPGNISPQSIEETKVRLAYDFYYLKHRSLALDLVIALKTVKRMLFRVSTW